MYFGRFHHVTVNVFNKLRHAVVDQKSIPETATTMIKYELHTLVCKIQKKLRQPPHIHKQNLMKESKTLAANELKNHKNGM
jgi:hypothetical protein